MFIIINLNDIKENGYKNAYSCIKDYKSALKYKKPFLQEVDSIMIRNELFFIENSDPLMVITESTLLDINRVPYLYDFRDGI